MIDPVPVQDIDRVNNTGSTRVVSGPELRAIFMGMDQKRDELLNSSVKGKNPFKDFALQEAAMALRQGAGRLIRRESDCGILVVADARLTKGYGKWLQRQLPPMRKLASEDEFQAEIARLTRTSTKDCPSA